MTADHGLGRKPFVPDPRDFPLAKLLVHLERGAAATRHWPDSEPVLDQGATGHCVGFGCAQWGNTLPVNDRFRDPDGHALYYESLAAGGQPKGENGSEVRWGLKALAKRGRIASYHRAASYAEALAWVRSAQGGSVILGINWYSGFDCPTKSGLVHLSGQVRGGHCLLMPGATSSYAYLLNSWGPSWAKNGVCHVRHASLAQLVDNDGGEAWVAIENKL